MVSTVVIVKLNIILDTTIRKYKKALKLKIQQLINDEWKVANEPLPVYNPKKYHRTKYRNVPEINDVKTNIQRKLGVTGPFLFLQLYGKLDKIPGPYRNIEKGTIFVLLTHLYRVITYTTFINWIFSFRNV